MPNHNKADQHELRMSAKSRQKAARKKGRKGTVEEEAYILESFVKLPPRLNEIKGASSSSCSPPGDAQTIPQLKPDDYYPSSLHSLPSTKARDVSYRRKWRTQMLPCQEQSTKPGRVTKLTMSHQAKERGPRRFPNRTHPHILTGRWFCWRIFVSLAIDSSNTSRIASTFA